MKGAFVQKGAAGIIFDMFKYSFQIIRKLSWLINNRKFMNDNFIQYSCSATFRLRIFRLHFLPIRSLDKCEDTEPRVDKFVQK